MSADGRTVFGWVEGGAPLSSGWLAARRDVVRFDAGSDGVFGTSDDHRVALDPACGVDPAGRLQAWLVMLP